jgi:tRNA A37 methylthiotransferase MiaB
MQDFRKPFNPSKDTIFMSSMQRGCDSLSSDLSRIETFFEVNGYKFASSESEASVIVLGSCVFKNDLICIEKKRIARTARAHPNSCLIVFGCLPGFEHGMRDAGRIVMIGTRSMGRFDNLFEHSVPVASVHTSGLSSDYKSYCEEIAAGNHAVKISDGCAGNCSYCNTKKAKGFVSSKPVESVLDEARNVLAKGGTDIVLVSDDCGSYGLDIGTDISELLLRLAGLDCRLIMKINTFFPGLFIKHYPAIKHLFKQGRITYACIPVQSGSKRILSLMNRDYDIDKMREIITEMRGFGGLKLVTHVIMNFPTETMEEFEESLKVADLFHRCIFVRYCENSGTAASAIGPKCSDADLKLKVDRIKSDGKDGVMRCEYVLEERFETEEADGL